MPVPTTVSSRAPRGRRGPWEKPWLTPSSLRSRPEEPVLVPMDDTTAQHRGKCVYGKGCHHDAVVWPDIEKLKDNRDSRLAFFLDIEFRASSFLSPGC